jgi:hypothetical protein
MLIGIIPNLSQSTGFLGMKQDSYNLIVTPTRLVFAYVSQQLMKQAVEDARQGARSEGKGFFGQWGAQMGWLSIILQRYQTMPVDSILTEFPGSFIIPTAQVTRVRLKQAQSHDDQPASVPELTIESAAGKSRFRMAGMPMKDARRLLQQVLPHAVK